MENLKYIKIYVLMVILSLCSCRSAIVVTQENQIAPDYAIDLVINDFLLSHLTNQSDLIGAQLLFRDSMQIQAIVVNPIYKEEDSFSVDFLRKFLGQYTTGIPTEYREKAGKLFYWNNPKVPLSQDMIDALARHGLIGELILVIDDVKLKTYYFCKSDYRKYKTRYLLNSMAKIPCLDCEK